MELKETNHSYYCSESNFYVGGDNNWGKFDFEVWKDFYSNWCGNVGRMDDDYNHVFRFDIKNTVDLNNDDIPGKYSLHLYFVHQRKGIYRPVYIKVITQEDMPEIEKFLRDRWEYMKNQWSEIISLEKDSTL